jgi:hypothetical protein
MSEVPLYLPHKTKAHPPFPRTTTIGPGMGMLEVERTADALF